MRGVDDDEARRGPERADQPLGIEGPAIGLAQVVEGDVRAGGTADLVQALVAGPRDDRVVAGREEDVRETEDRLLGTGEDQDVVGIDRLVQRRDLGPEERMARGLGVSQAEVAPQGRPLLV